jgi:hypothetical protein
MKDLLNKIILVYSCKFVIIRGWKYFELQGIKDTPLPLQLSHELTRMYSNKKKAEVHPIKELAIFVWIRDYSWLKIFELREAKDITLPPVTKPRIDTNVLE